MKIFKRLVWSIKLAIIAFRGIEKFNVDSMKIIDRIGEVLKESSDTNSPKMAHIGFIDIETKKSHNMLTLWVAPTERGTPLDRIIELCKERDNLKEQLLNKK